MLRPYQTEAIDSIRQQIAGGKKRIVIVLPTGAGKTTIASEIIRLARANGKTSIFVAHRQELVYQAHERLAHFGIDAGIIMPPHKANGHAVHVASVQTLIRRQHPPADIVFIDEAHHCTSSSYKIILANYPDAWVFGLTATPYRRDGKGLGETFEELLVPITMQELIDQGYLVMPRYFGAKEDFSDIKIKMGEYDNNQLFEKIDRKILYDGVVDKFRQFGQGKALVFCVNIEHSMNTRNVFVNAGYKTEHIDCDTENWVRKNILRDFQNNKIQILVNCALFTEGYDLPDINTVILNRATKSRGLYFQMVGRALRPAQGKTHCIVIDHGNNVFEHGPVEADQEYSLNGNKKKKKEVAGEKAEQARECPACMTLLGIRTQTCPFCGYNFPINHTLLTAEFEEIKIRKVVIPKHLRKPWSQMNDEELEEYRKLKGYKSGWVWHQKKARKEKERIKYG